MTGEHILSHLTLIHIPYAVRLAGAGITPSPPTRLGSFPRSHQREGLPQVRSDRLT